MSRRREAWSESLRAVSRSAADVARAELALLRIDYERWGKRFGVAIALFLGAGWVVLWCLVLLLYTLIRVFETLLGLGVWQAPLAATGVAFVFAGILALVGYVIVRRLGDPMRGVKQRYGDHRRWWREQILGEPIDPAGGIES